LPGDDSGDILRADAVPVVVNLDALPGRRRLPDRGPPRFGEGAGGPRRSVERGYWLRGGAERGAGRVLMSAAPPPYDAGTSPQWASPDGGAYARRYHDREHVNESGHGGLPVGVVPAAVLGVSGHPAWWAAYTSTSQNPAAAAAVSTSAQQA